MKVGDIVKVSPCPPDSESPYPCPCFFCCHSSNRIGVITGRYDEEEWCVHFDAGDWPMSDADFGRGHAEILYESR